MMNLNQEQAIAVNNIDGPMIVLAGPGTGKTQIIAHRIAKILETTQMSPHNILCLTFTEMGVVAMRKRLLGIIGTDAYYVRIHTFHSFCNEIIKEFPEKFAFKSELEPLTEVERVKIFREIIDDLEASSPIKPFGAPYLYQRDLSNLIQDLKRENISPEKLKKQIEIIESEINSHSDEIESFIAIHGNSLREADITNIVEILKDTSFAAIFLDTDFSDKKERTRAKNDLKNAYLELKNQIPRQKALNLAYQKYQEKLLQKGRYDFEDMILFVVNKFKEDEELLAKYQEQFQYILVDEYQDTNGAQNEVVRLIGEYFSNPNIFVVGDDKQSIYRFQGASLENILFFYKLYKEDIKLVSLKNNYRSHQTILDAAHSLISHNEQGISHYIPELSQNLTANANITEEKIQIAEFDSIQSENYFLVKRAKELIDAGTSPSEIAILYRYNYEARDLVDLFLRLNVPFKLEAGVNILEDTEINKIITLLHLVSDLTNEPLLFKVLHFDFLNFKPIDILKLNKKAYDEKKELLTTMLETEIFKPFAELLLSLKTLSINRPLMEFFDHLIKESNFLDHTLNRPDKVEQLNRLNTFFDEIKAINRNEHDISLEAFLEYLDLLTENDIAISEHELATKKNAVRLMTAHKSKGLEFEYVFIKNCVDNTWGNTRSRDKIKLPRGLLSTELSNKERNEDERRLFYVAMTRAKKGLTISFSKNNEKQRPQVPSLFLSEIDKAKTENFDTEKIENEALQRLQSIFLEIPQQEYDEEERNFLKSLLENYTMSVTHLNNYLRCPRLFYYQNLLRAPSAKNKHAAFGSAIHESLRDLAIASSKGNLSKAELLASFEKHLKRQVLTEQDYRGSLEFGKETLSDYYDSHEIPKSIIPEYDFSSHGVNLDGIPLTGKIDKIEIIDPTAKTVRVVDYKTGNPDSKSKELGPDGEYTRQIAFYKLLCELSPKFPYKMSSGQIDFVQRSTKDNAFKSKEYQITEQDLENLKIQIKAVYDDIMNLKFLNVDEWETCGECDYCKGF